MTKKPIEEMSSEELSAELDKHDPRAVRAALENALLNAGMTNADLRALLEATLKRDGPPKH